MFPFSRSRRAHRAEGDVALGPGSGGFRIGEVLRISCASAQARVVGVSATHFMLVWPWGTVDPASTGVRWDGTFAFPRDPDHPEWHNTPWRIEADDLSGLSVGDACAVGIPPKRVRVQGVRRHQPPADLGRLPRPELTLNVVFRGDERRPDAGFSLRLPPAEPLRIEHEDAP
ncbi:hypothetical protein [Actinospica robiniae]|uniref:hypothetical protein n=1 Tax=Actinospica robiniae TaxID=304901 RepID=UPI00040BBA9B|nr:hypothetical protein [Actinospica robiniae]